LGWWVVAAVISTAITLLALYRYYTQGGGSTPRPTLVLIAASFSSIGLVYGMSPWVAGHGSVALVLLFALFPSTASAVGCIVTAGRRDLYLSFLIPLIVVSASTLLLADDSRLRGLGVLAVFFGMALLVLHHVISRNTVASIRLQWRSERLLRDLAHERSELTG
jgi:hypothetical protein